jgi:hypothetical protein
MSENDLPVAPVQNIVHTPGPWGVEQTTVSNWIGRMRADGSKVEYIVAHIDRDSLRDDVLVRNDANARLIALAPEMFDLLRRFVHGELPEADENCTPDTVNLTVSHMDHEDYRHRIRQAKELISRVV